MKKIAILFTFIFLVFFCHAQIITSVKQENGKVIFRDTVSSDLNKEEIHSRLINWLNTKLLPHSGIITSNDTIQGIITCQIMDFLEMDKKAFSVFTMYVRYQLILQFFDKQYIITIRNIYFIDPVDYQGNYTIPSQKRQYSAEFVMLQKKYNVLTVKNASNKLTDAAIQRFNEVFEMARKAVTSDSLHAEFVPEN